MVARARVCVCVCVCALYYNYTRFIISILVTTTYYNYTRKISSSVSFSAGMANIAVLGRAFKNAQLDVR